MPAGALAWEQLGTLNEAGIKGLVAFDGGYVAYGSTDALGPVAWFSADGRTWEATPLAAQHLNCPDSGPPGDDYVPDAAVTAAATNGRQVLLAGAEQLFTDAACSNPGASLRMVAWVSSDGRTWQRSDGFAPGTPNARVASAWPVGDGWQVVDEFSGVADPSSAEVWASPDGLAWQRAAVALRQTTAAVAPLAIGPDGALIVNERGQQGGPFFGLAAWDGGAWRDVTPPAPCDGEPAIVLPPAPEAPGSWLLAAGQGVCSSTDLVSWSGSLLPAETWAMTMALARTRYGTLSSVSEDCSDCAQPAPWVNALSSDGRTWFELGSPVQALHLADGPAGVIGLGPEGIVWRLHDTRPVATPAPGAPHRLTARRPGRRRRAAEPLGRTWVQAKVPAVVDRPIGRIEAVTAGGPGFVAVGRGCIGEAPTCEAIVWTSADGRAWTRAPASDATDIGAYLATTGPAIGMFDVAAGTPGIVAIGYAARPDLQATVWFSADGTSWERIPLGLEPPAASPGGLNGARVNAVTWDGGQFVIVGEDRSDWKGFGSSLTTAKARAAAWTSPDGRSWTRVPHAPVFEVGGFIDTTEDPSTGGMADVMAGPDGLVAVGSVCNTKASAGCQPAVWTSPDGTSWTRLKDVPAMSGGLRALATSDARTAFVAVGAATVLTSRDGLTWVQQPVEPPNDFQGVTWIGDRFFATVLGGPETVWTSEDGSAWIPASVQGGPAADARDATALWHFAARPDVAVWLGLPTESADPAAWVSVVGATP